MSAARSSRSPDADSTAGMIADHAGRASRYLTDGVDLYRCLGGLLPGPGQFVALENCRSLEVILLPVKELHARRLRAVTPAGSETEREPCST